MSVPFLSPGARTLLLTPAVTIVLYLILLTGLSTLLVAAIPISLGDAQWRFNNAVQALSAAPQIAFLLMMILVASAHGGQYNVTRATAFVSMFFGAAFLILLPFFGLDFLTARHLQPTEGMGHFMREGVRLAGVSGLMGLALIWAGWRAYMISNTTPEARRTKGEGLVVAQNEQPI